MSWQTPTINPATTSPATDITKITNDLALLKSILSAAGTDSDFSKVAFGYNVLINTTTDDGVNKLQVAGGVKVNTHSGASGTRMDTGYRITDMSTYNYAWGVSTSGGLDIHACHSGVGLIKFFNGTYATPAEIARFTDAKRLLLGTTTEATSGANAGIMQLAATSSSGIYLGNTANAAANVLDWYEEGTFTPTIAGDGTAGAGTYTGQTGKYTRIGNVVHYSISLSWTAHTGAGGMRINGLPFAIAFSGQAASLYYSGLIPASNKDISVKTGAAASTYLEFFSTDVTTGIATVFTLDTNALVVISGSYFV